MFQKIVFIGILLLLPSFYVSAQSGNTTDGSQGNGNMDTTGMQQGGFTDTVTHLFNIDSLDKAKQNKDHAAFLKAAALNAENDKIWLKNQIGALSNHNMMGRGYVKRGVDTAAIYILRKFREFKLKPVGRDGAFTQGFAFPVNTFPGKMKLFVNGDSIKSGVDFLVDPASSSFSGEELKIKKINLNDIADRAAWKITLAQLDTQHAYYFENTDLFCSKILNVKRSVFLGLLPRGCYIIPQAGHLQWNVSRDTMAATVLYVHPDAMPKVLKSASVAVTARFIPHDRNLNLIGCVPGVVKDSYIVFSAHYDHLGMMGNATMFPGASDDASGVAMMLYLASFYAKHPPHYTMVFIAFAGEEASLMGSEFFVAKPMIPLKKIRFMMNMDLLGDATNGVTIVNATAHPTEFGLLKAANDKEKFVPEIKSKGPAANSDHYYFDKAGVPAFFMYTNGGKGYYHDVFDKPKELTANNLDGVARMLISFARELQ